MSASILACLFLERNKTPVKPDTLSRVDGESVIVVVEDGAAASLIGSF